MPKRVVLTIDDDIYPILQSIAKMEGLAVASYCRSIILKPIRTAQKIHQQSQKVKQSQELAQKDTNEPQNTPNEPDYNARIADAESAMNPQ